MTDSDKEYDTLRAELLALQAFSRQILYWTVILIVGVLAWNAGAEAETPRIEWNRLKMILYIAIVFSGAAYFFFVCHTYRIGGYIAVFLETQPGKHWHRMHRHFVKALDRRKKPVWPFLSWFDYLPKIGFGIYPALLLFVWVCDSLLGKDKWPNLYCLIIAILVAIAIVYGVTRLFAKVMLKTEEAWKHTFCKEIQNEIDGMYLLTTEPDER